MKDLNKVIGELKNILYGDSDSKPAVETCAQLAIEFFREDNFHLLITCLPKLNFETRKQATQIVTNLQGQKLQSRLIACEYMERNLALMDILIAGYILDSQHMKKFFEYIQLPNFDVAAGTFKELLTRHKSTVADFLSKNDDRFFADYNSKLLVSTNYITRRQALKLLSDILLERSNSAVMIRYVSSMDNLRILMNLLRVSSKSIQIETFHVFKLFAANQNKPTDIINILVANRTKLLRLIADINSDKDDEKFNYDKSQVIREISALNPINDDG
ncbi:putative MO25-like protein At5g47540 [Salvia splendens]|uniref:putative MO25-like protein At5g47540 n=1 Tax=Salvia splendens TaxID=180675 RepID=UPI001C25F6BA|nr:putative MO25-like protein At5g47540 [Salvia splendens]